MTGRRTWRVGLPSGIDINQEHFDYFRSRDGAQEPGRVVLGAQVLGLHHQLHGKTNPQNKHRQANGDADAVNANALVIVHVNIICVDKRSIRGVARSHRLRQTCRLHKLPWPQLPPRHMSAGSAAGRIAVVPPENLERRSVVAALVLDYTMVIKISKDALNVVWCAPMQCEWVSNENENAIAWGMF